MSNLFDLIRLVAALAVFVSHSFPINGFHEPMILWGYTTLGSLGVSVFFGLSGYLVMQSWDRRPCIKAFLFKRIKRIFPGLIAVVCILAFVYGPAVSALKFGEYFSHSQLYIFLRMAILMGNDRLPDTLHNNPFPDAVDSSLWTLKYEFLMYIILAVLASQTKKLTYIVESIWVVFGALNILLWVFPGLFKLPASLLALQDPLKFTIGFGGTFFTGVVIAKYRSFLQNDMRLVLIALICFSIACFFKFGGAVAWLIIPYCVILSGEKSYAFLLKFNPKNDISYGMYIYAFPLQQLAVYLLGADKSYTSFLINSFAALLATILFAFLSWKLIESPFLQKRTH